MPLRPRINTLPPKLRGQLDARLVAANFGRIVETAAWLQSKGHQIGKSAVGVYAKKLQATLAAEAAAATATRATPGAIALRLACLQAAAQSQGTTAAVLKRAEAYASWARTGRAPR